MRGMIGTAQTIEKPRRNKKKSCWKCSQFNCDSMWCSSFKCMVSNTTLGTCKRFNERKKKNYTKPKSKKQNYQSKPKKNISKAKYYNNTLGVN